MIIEKRDNNIYTKSLSEMEGYLLNIVKRFFEKEHDSMWESREAIISESVRRAKEEILMLSSAVTSVNGEKGDVVLDYSDVGAEPTIKKNTAFNKNFGVKKGTVCEGDDPRLDKSDLYTKEEIDNLIESIKRLTAGIKFNIFKEDWINDGESFVAILNHNLNLNIESFSISFYKNGENCCLDHKILTNNTVKVFSDEAADIVVAMKQAIAATVAIPTDIRELIEQAVKVSEENKVDITNIKKEDLETAKDIETLKQDNTTNKESIETNTSEIANVKHSVGNILDRIDGFAEINHKHTTSDITNLESYINSKVINDYGNVSIDNKKMLKLKRGTDSSFIIYCGEIGEIVVNTETKTIHVMDGVTPGGTAVSKDGHTHSYNDLLERPVIDLSNYFTKDETFNKEEIENLVNGIDISTGLSDYYTKAQVDLLIKKINEMEEIILPGEEIVDGNITYRVQNLERKVIELKREIILKQSYEILESDWILNESSGLYEYVLNHNEKLDFTDINISFFVQNAPYIFKYEYIDLNNIKVLTRSLTDVLVILKVKTGIRNEIVEGGEDNAFY